MEKRSNKRPSGKFDLRITPARGRMPKAPAPFPQKPPYRPGKNLSSQKKAAPPKRPRAASASWGAVSEWYQTHLKSADTYHEKVILPNILRLLDPKEGERILDLACGEGYFTRALAAKGATMTGIDLGQELIVAAKKASPEIAYHAGSAENLSRFPSGAFDKALVVLAIQNIEHPERVFAETARVLLPNGMLHIVMNHPAFRIPKSSSWGYDEKARAQYRRVDRYLSESRAAIDMHPGMKGSPQTLSFHRPLQYYVKALVKAGFVVDRLEEWISHKASDSGPRADAENRSRKEIPLFLYMRTRKM